MAVMETTPMTIREISIRLGIPYERRGMIGHVLSRLAASGYVEKEQNYTDATKYWLAE